MLLRAMPSTRADVSAERWERTRPWQRRAGTWAALLSFRASWKTLAVVVVALAFLANASTLSKATSVARSAVSSGCEWSLRWHLHDLQLQQYSNQLCSKGYTRLEDVLHLDKDLCAPPSARCENLRQHQAPGL